MCKLPWESDVGNDDVWLQTGTQVLCDTKTHSVAEVVCVGVNRILTGTGSAAGGFSILKPLPEVMWGSDARLKLPLRRVSLPEEGQWEAHLSKECAKLPHRLECARLHKSVRLDAGRKFPECSLEVCADHEDFFSQAVSRLASRVRRRRARVHLCTNKALQVPWLYRPQMWTERK
jgi:hypothetical protein